MQYEKFDKEQLIKILYEKDKYINHLKKKNKQLKYYATMDSMTSVANRARGIKLLNKKMVSKSRRVGRGFRTKRI
ncbi:hypothetical protein OXH55_00870 [Clostridium ganghwense]|uniref:Uncharacterized protein n=1 Tax=Clostridium ganghwense TaxID=312089 RepID=A0ABT4CMH0_9CLOT|nr:hypothetical protein [Clostridium ganghwense]MCY6369194.1 hypothetical protein [Clostridium ganghwense]